MDVSADIVIRFGRYRISLYNPLLIFLLSVAASLALLALERSVGIEWDYHLDAYTYIEWSKFDQFSIESVLSNFAIWDLAGNAWYYIVNIFNSNINALIGLNILVYSITNVTLANFYYKNIDPCSKGVWLLFLLVIFNPYRTHLSVHVLKDTLIIISIVYFFIVPRAYSWLFILLSFFMSFRAVLYLVAIFNKKNFIFVLTPVLLFIFFEPGDFISKLDILPHTLPSMTFRDYDNVPNFLELGMFGSIIRVILWPLLALSGAFFLISPTVMYLPIAVGALLLQLWCYKKYRKPAFYFQVYLALGLFAIVVTGFTTYIRYAVPLITILPILIIRHNSVHFEKYRK